MLTHKGGFSLEWYTQRVIYDGPNVRLTGRSFHNDDLQKLSTEMAAFLRYLAPKVWVLVGNDPSKYPMSQIEEAARELGFWIA